MQQKLNKKLKIIRKRLIKIDGSNSICPPIFYKPWTRKKKYEEGTQYWIQDVHGHLKDDKMSHYYFSKILVLKINFSSDINILEEQSSNSLIIILIIFVFHETQYKQFIVTTKLKHSKLNVSY